MSARRSAPAPEAARTAHRPVVRWTNNPDTQHDPDPTRKPRSLGPRPRKEWPLRPRQPPSPWRSPRVTRPRDWPSLVARRRRSGAVRSGASSTSARTPPAQSRNAPNATPRRTARGEAFFSAAPFAGTTALGGALMLTRSSPLGAVAIRRRHRLRRGEEDGVHRRMAAHVAFTLVVGVGALRRAHVGGLGGIERVRDEPARRRRWPPPGGGAPRRDTDGVVAGLLGYASERRQGVRRGNGTERNHPVASRSARLV